ncbi:uncharacterized protein LOC581871 [Strongylocentrotus purpuratus]|uniref:Dynein light chain n=1 Tax=Strongylocentrotus purpuratus TaxID=7668 RepID=A0A7M7PMN5_STRPU|nr:uncharacterized protein LOC581871 [Strongylocentrotus purpuratus]
MSYAKKSSHSDKEPTIVVKNADMDDDLQEEAIDLAKDAFQKFTVEKDIASYIKKEFDAKFQPTWHCIVGRNYGSYVTHETKHFIYFYHDQKAILLFKSGYGGRIRSHFTIKTRQNNICESSFATVYFIFWFVVSSNKSIMNRSGGSSYSGKSGTEKNKIEVKNADMDDDMQELAIDLAKQMLEDGDKTKKVVEKDVAAFIKKEFDKNYDPTWHCIVGRNYGSYVTHETKHFIYFYHGQTAILLFKSG